MTKQLAHRLVTPHAVFSSRVTSSLSENASLSLCFPPQAQRGTAALPVLVLYSLLVLQSPSLSQLFSVFIEQTPASTRVLSSSGKGNHNPVQIYIWFIRFSQLQCLRLQDVWTYAPIEMWIDYNLDANRCTTFKIITACLQILCSVIPCTMYLCSSLLNCAHTHSDASGVAPPDWGILKEFYVAPQGK